MLFNKKFKDINIEDINSLVENSVCENKSLEYKRELNIGTDAEKKEFLADVSSFANSTGGDIVFGVEEDGEEKIPTKVCGITYENEDKLIRKLEDFIRQSIQPIILDIEYKVIEIKENTCVLIIRIPQSLIAPHRVEYKGTDKFYTRNNKGKYAMDVNELRIAFNSGLNLEKRIEDFKMNRYYELISNQNNKLVDELPIFVIHYIPISSMNELKNHISLKTIKNEMINCNSQALGYGYNKEYTIDGVIIAHKDSYNSSIAKYYNNGIIEKATTNFFKKQYEITNISPSIVIDLVNGYKILNNVIEDFIEVKNYYEKIGISSPIVISCSILKASGYTIPNGSFYDILNKIDREILCMNNVYVEDFSQKAENILKPIFDSIWNACGYERCIAYDENGNYIGLNY